VLDFDDLHMPSTTHIGFLRGGEGDDGAYGEALAAARAAGEHRDLGGQRQPDGLFLLVCEVGAGVGV
jgi:hypothetical protein